MQDSDRSHDGPLEIAIAGDLTDQQTDLCDKLLSVEPGGQCVLYFDSPGGSPYCGVALTSLIMLRGLRATGIVAGECSSAALWPFAACSRRLVTPYSVCLFHHMKWQSEENVGLLEAAEWARHFGALEQDMDALLSRLFRVTPEKISQWTHAGRYVGGAELATAGLAELVELAALPFLHCESDKPRNPKRKRGSLSRSHAPRGNALTDASRPRNRNGAAERP